MIRWTGLTPWGFEFPLCTQEMLRDVAKADPEWKVLPDPEPRTLNPEP